MRDDGSTRRHEFVQSRELALRHERALARTHRAWCRQSLRYGTAEERFPNGTSSAKRRLAKLDKDIEKVTSDIKRIEEHAERGQVHFLVLKPSPDDPECMGISQSQIESWSVKGGGWAMMLEDMREDDRREAVMARKAVVSSKSGR